MTSHDTIFGPTGTHDYLDEYDRAMAADARVVVLVASDRILGNAPA